ASKRNRISKEEFACENCGFKLNAQYVACLNMFSRLHDGRITIMGERIILIPRKAAPVVPANVAPNDVLIIMRRERGSLRPLLKFPS
ncbi:MAG: hypothetical protein DRN30_05050, partial [Thermoplasmata archaeon]